MENRLILYSASVRICFFMYSTVGMGPRLTSSCTPRQRTVGQSLMKTAGTMTRVGWSLEVAEGVARLGAACVSWRWLEAGELVLRLCSGCVLLEIAEGAGPLC